MGARRHGRGALALCSVFVLQMLSEVSVQVSRRSIYELFEKIFWGLCLQTPTGILPLDPPGDFRPSDPLIAHPGKILRAPMGRPISINYQVVLMLLVHFSINLLVIHRNRKLLLCNLSNLSIAFASQITYVHAKAIFRTNKLSLRVLAQLA